MGDVSGGKKDKALGEMYGWRKIVLTWGKNRKIPYLCS